MEFKIDGYSIADIMKKIHSGQGSMHEGDGGRTAEVPPPTKWHFIASVATMNEPLKKLWIALAMAMQTKGLTEHTTLTEQAFL